tara:strand:- start:277 stop:1059 length:783 start_codon:yes stop_codon:yes gene_type:complete
MGTIMNVFFFSGVIINHNFGIFHDGSPTTLYAALIIQIICSLIILFLFKQPAPAHPKRDMSESYMLFSQRVTRLFVSSKTRKAFLVIFLNFLGWSLYTESFHQTVHHPVYGVSSNYNYFMVYDYFIAALATLMILFLHKYFLDIKTIVMYGALFVIVGLLGSTLFPGQYIQCFWATVTCIGFGFLTITIYYVSNARGPRFYGLIMGLFTATLALVTVLSNIIISALDIIFVPSQTLYIIMGLIFLIMGFLWFFTMMYIKE